MIFNIFCQYLVKNAKVTMGGISETGVTLAMTRYCSMRCVNCTSFRCVYIDLHGSLWAQMGLTGPEACMWRMDPMGQHGPREAEDRAAGWRRAPILKRSCQKVPTPPPKSRAINWARARTQAHGVWGALCVQTYAAKTFTCFEVVWKLQKSSCSPMSETFHVS